MEAPTTDIDFDSIDCFSSFLFLVICNTNFSKYIVFINDMMFAHVVMHFVRFYFCNWASLVKFLVILNPAGCMLASSDFAFIHLRYILL